MSKHARVEAIRKLKEQLAVATDPETVLKITNQIAKFTPKPRQARRLRRAEALQTPSNTKLSIIDRVTGSAVDDLPDGGKVFNWLVCEVEQMQREQHRQFNAEERNSTLAKLVEGLCARDRAAL